MGTILHKTGVLLRTCDCFSTPINLRYDGDDQKATKTGGCLSVALITILVVAFYRSWLNVFQKKEIKAEYTVFREMDPSSIELSADDFLISVSVSMFNWADPLRYFDLEVTQEIRQNGKPAISELIKMEPCSKEKFAKYGVQFADIFDRLYLNSSVCLPPNLKWRIGGKWSSQTFQYLRIHIKRCSTTSPGCMSNADFENYLKVNGAFFANFYFVNRLINPSKLEPISIYFEDKNYNMVNDQIAIDTNLYISEFEIETDQSLIPLEQMNVTKGVFVDRTEKEQFVHPAQNGSYVQFHFRKSDQKISIKREFRKIDDLLSYIGGLFGIIAFIFGYLMTNYSQCCFELEMCNKVFKDEEKEEEKGSESSSEGNEPKDEEDAVIEEIEEEKDINFNFITFLRYLLYQVLITICPNIKWKRMENLQEKLEETRNQMNIDTLLQKISLHQKSFECVFNDDQILLLFLQEKISIKQLKDQRVIMNLGCQPPPQTETPLIRGNMVSNEHQLSVSRRPDIALSTYLRKSQAFNLRQTSFPESHLMDICKSNKEIRDQITGALKNIKRKADDGDDVCQRILEGVRKDIKEKYKKWIVKKRPKRLPKISFGNPHLPYNLNMGNFLSTGMPLPDVQSKPEQRRDSNISKFYIEEGESNASFRN